jgi:hypothetical protein
MFDDPQWELAILGSVHSFYEKLVAAALHDQLLVPKGLDAESLAEPSPDLNETLVLMRQWLRLLDLAVTTSMLRTGLGADGDPELAEALLRYYAHKVDPNESDRDKTDFVATFLYKNPRVPGQWDSQGLTIDGSIPLPPFEIALMEILTQDEALPLPETAELYLFELDALREQAQKLNTFDEIMDFAIIQRGRRLKQLLGEYFYHPAILHSIAAYNVTLGRQFQSLFREAAREIKTFAQSVQRTGANPHVRLDGDVTVQDVANMQEEEVLSDEYSVAQERFQRMLRVKKSLEERKPKSTAAMAQAAGASPTPPGVTVLPVRPVTTRPALFTGHYTSAGTVPGMHPAAAFRYDPGMEDVRLKNITDSIRKFVRTAGPKVREIVPMRSFNLVLTAAEAEAFCAEIDDDDTLQGATARALVRMVAILTRMGAEYEELKQHQNSPMIGKPHAAALRHLVQLGRGAAEQAEDIFFRTEQQNDTARAASLLESLDRLRGRADFVSEFLDRWTMGKESAS